MRGRNGFRLRLTQREIADASGISQQMVHYVVNGDRMPSAQVAEQLERATGVCREAWLWPEIHYNPYIPFNEGKQCLLCVNRHRTIRFFSVRAQKYLLENPTLEAFQIMSDATHEFSNNSQRGFVTLWSYYNKQSNTFTRLGASGDTERNLPFNWKQTHPELWPYVADQARQGNDFITSSLQATLRNVGDEIGLQTAIDIDATAMMQLTVEGRSFCGIAFNGLPYGNPPETLVAISKGFLRSEAMDKLIATLD